MSIVPKVCRNLFEATTDQSIDTEQTSSQTHDNNENGSVSVSGSESDSSYENLLDIENEQLIAEIAKAEASLAEEIAQFPDRIDTICAKYHEMIETRSKSLEKAKRLELDEEIKRLKDWHETEMSKLKMVKSQHLQNFLLSNDTTIDPISLEIISGMNDL